MKKLPSKITIRLVAAMLVIVAVIGLSAVVTHVPAQSQNPLALKSIQTDKATQFHVAAMQPTGMWFVELVLPGTAESKAATENLKQVAATL
jgi:disulfide bond formation protein DsbB